MEGAAAWQLGEILLYICAEISSAPSVNLSPKYDWQWQLANQCTQAWHTLGKLSLQTACPDLPTATEDQLYWKHVYPGCELGHTVPKSTWRWSKIDTIPLTTSKCGEM